MPKKAEIETITVNVRLPKGMVDEIDEAVEHTGRWRSRSHFLTSAVEKYLELVRLDRMGIKVYHIPSTDSRTIVDYLAPDDPLLKSGRGSSGNDSKPR